MKVYFDTFGCRLSRAEALQQEADYLADGWSLADGHADADLIIVRGCAVTAHAQSECRRLIDHIRRKYPQKHLLLKGCIPDADTNRRRSAVSSLAPVASDGSAVPVRTARAYLKVQDGCSGKCAFCIVPQFRGKSSSVPFAALLDKARRFIDAGYHEIVVTGCNLSLYASEGRRLPELLAALAALDPALCRIRLGSLEPGDVADETIRAMAENANVCRFLHVPVQSGSSMILAMMRRPYKIADVEEMLRTAARLMPGLGLGCDLMTGFPGEGEMEFLATKSLLKRFPFTNAHVFPFSERPHTAAAQMSGRVPEFLRRDRAHELSAVASRQRSDFARRFVGKTVEVVVEDDEKIAGWSQEYLWCRQLNDLATSKTRGLRKQKIRLKIVEAHHGHLRGVPV